jgi:hypothetical protein
VWSSPVLKTFSGLFGIYHPKTAPPARSRTAATVLIASISFFLRGLVVGSGAIGVGPPGRSWFDTTGPVGVGGVGCIKAGPAGADGLGTADVVGCGTGPGVTVGEAGGTDAESVIGIEVTGLAGMETGAAPKPLLPEDVDEVSAGEEAWVALGFVSPAGANCCPGI